jgi:hypothetical protein
MEGWAGHSDESSGIMKGGEFLDQLGYYQHTRNDCFVQLHETQYMKELQ